VRPVALRKSRRRLHLALPERAERARVPGAPADTRDIPDLVADRIQHANRLADLATIKPNDRRTLYLKGLGYRYTEIMRITGASYTSVNRRITEGRRALRKLEREREDTQKRR
jgi:DNA-directed RNA polymerase specialized sigma24 family protein